MLIVSFSGDEAWNQGSDLDFSEVADSANASRRLVVERLEALAEQAEVDIELASEGVLDSDLVSALREEGVGWKVRPSPAEPWPGFRRRPGKSDRSRYFSCSNRRGGDRS